MFDRNGDGFISKAEFKHCMMHFGEQFTDDEVEEMIAEADQNQVRKISNLNKGHEGRRYHNFTSSSAMKAAN